MSKVQQFNYQVRIKKIREQFGFDFIALALEQNANDRYEFKWEYADGNRSNRYKRIILQTGKGVVGNVFKSGKPMLITEIASFLESTNLFDYPIIQAEGLTSLGAIPLYNQNRVQGVLLVAYRDERKLTAEKFSEFKEKVGPSFGPFYYKEMKAH